MLVHALKDNCSSLLPFYDYRNRTESCSKFAWTMCTFIFLIIGCFFGSSLGVASAGFLPFPSFLSFFFFRAESLLAGYTQILDIFYSQLFYTQILGIFNLRVYYTHIIFWVYFTHSYFIPKFWVYFTDGHFMPKFGVYFTHGYIYML